MNSEPHDTPAPHPIRVADLPEGRASTHELVPPPRTLERIRDTLGLLGLRKLRFKVTLAPSGKSDWRLSGDLGATVQQPCVLTLAPVTTRIDEKVERLFVAGFQQPQDDDEETEMPEDDNIEPLGQEIDLGAVMVEALALALPLYPRAEGAELGTSVFTEAGKTPMQDEDARPFAKLAALKNKLKNDD